MSKQKSTNKPSRHSTWTQSYGDRALLPHTSPLAAYLFRLMMAKRTNLCLSADVESTSQLLDIAEECGDSICILKTHADIVHDFGERAIHGLTEIAARKQFLVFEDRKFGDIGSTVQAQYAAGPLRIASWANIVNAHVFPGPSVITALKEAADTAIVVFNSSVSTQISGGDSYGDSGSYFPKNAVASGSSSDADEDEDEDDDDDDRLEVSHSSSGDDTIPAPRPSHRPERLKLTSSNKYSSSGRNITRQAAQGRQHTSVVTVSTTISSSTEYTSPPLLSAASPRSIRSTISPLHPASLPISASFSFQPSGESTPLGGPPLCRGLLLLAQMSSVDNMFTGDYTARCAELAREQRDFVLGFIAQQSLNSAPEDNFITMTPGVKLPSSVPAISLSPNSERGDGMGQQYNTPKHLIVNKGVDVVIVGRGILNASDRRIESERYRHEAWAAYLERLATGDSLGGRDKTKR